MPKSDSGAAAAAAKPLTDHFCAVCYNPAPFACPKCHIVYYCSKPCQEKDWKTHKRNHKATIAYDFETFLKCFYGGNSSEILSAGASNMYQSPKTWQDDIRLGYIAMAGFTDGPLVSAAAMTFATKIADGSLPQLVYGPNRLKIYTAFAEYCKKNNLTVIMPFAGRSVFGHYLLTVGVSVYLIDLNEGDKRYTGHSHTDLSSKFKANVILLAKRYDKLDERIVSTVVKKYLDPKGIDYKNAVLVSEMSPQQQFLSAKEGPAWYLHHLVKKGLGQFMIIGHNADFASAESMGGPPSAIIASSGTVMQRVTKMTEVKLNHLSTPWQPCKGEDETAFMQRLSQRMMLPHAFLNVLPPDQLAALLNTTYRERTALSVLLGGGLTYSPVNGIMAQCANPNCAKVAKAKADIDQEPFAVDDSGAIVCSVPCYRAYCAFQTQQASGAAAAALPK